MKTKNIKKRSALFGIIILLFCGLFYVSFLSPSAKHSQCVENGGVWVKSDKECVCSGFQTASECSQKLESLNQ